MQTNIELKLNSCGRFLGHDVLPDRDSNSTQLLSDKTTHVWTRGTAGINGRYYGMEGKGQTKQISPNKHATIFYPFSERVVNFVANQLCKTQVSHNAKCNNVIFFAHLWKQLVAFLSIYTHFDFDPQCGPRICFRFLSKWHNQWDFIFIYNARWSAANEVEIKRSDSSQ